MRIASDAVLCIVNGIEHFLQVTDEEGCGGSGCLHPLKRHHVENVFVAVMADACDDRDGEVGHIERKLIAVERNGRIFVKCRCCGRQVEVARDPRGQDSRGQ